MSWLGITSDWQIRWMNLFLSMNDFKLRKFSERELWSVDSPFCFYKKDRTDSDSHLAISYHKTKSLAGKAWIFPIFSSSIQMVLYNSRNYSMLILAMFLLIIIKKEPNEDCISSLKCKSNWRMIVWVLFRLAAQALGFPFLSPYLQSIGSDYRHGANYATLASTVLLPNTSLFVTGISPFSLAIQLNQMKEFKVKVDEFHATNQTGDVTNI